MNTPADAGCCCACVADQITILGTGCPSNPFHAASSITPLRASGTSTSGTPGTNVATIAAAAGKKLVGVSIITGQTSAVNSQLTITVTYSDLTTTVLTTGAGTNQNITGNGAGLMVYAAGSFSSLTQLANKDIISVSVTTAGVGVGTRAATVTGLQT